MAVSQSHLMLADGGKACSNKPCLCVLSGCRFFLSKPFVPFGFRRDELKQIESRRLTDLVSTSTTSFWLYQPNRLFFGWCPASWSSLGHRQVALLTTSENIKGTILKYIIHKNDSRCHLFEALLTKSMTDSLSFLGRLWHIASIGLAGCTMTLSSTALLPSKAS